MRQALERGHQVTAFVRSPERMKPFSRRITIVCGDLLKSAELERAIEGRSFAGALTSAMCTVGVKRLTVESTAFLFKDSFVPPPYLIGRLFFRGIVTDAAAMEQIIGSSGLDWTIVRPPKLTNKPHTGTYRVREDHLPNFGFAIPRADVTDFMIATVEKSMSIGQVVGVCN